MASRASVVLMSCLALFISNHHLRTSVAEATKSTVIQQKVEKRTASTSFKWQVRLVNATLPFEGRVEVKLTPTGEWGSICDDDWDAYDAQVVCRMLGFNHAKARGIRQSGYGSAHTAAPIHLDEVRCTGEERTLADCDYSVTHNCEHSEDAGVLCQGALEDHFEHTSQLPKVFEHLRTLTDSFDTLRQGHFALKNETDALWRQLNDTVAAQHRINNAQIGLIQQQLAAYAEKNNLLIPNNKAGTFNGNEALQNKTAHILLLLPELEQQLSALEVKVSNVENSLRAAVNASTLTSSSARLPDAAASRKLYRLGEQVEQLSMYLYWMSIGLCVVFVLAVLTGIVTMACRNTRRRIALTSTTEQSKINNNEQHATCGPAQYVGPYRHNTGEQPGGQYIPQQQTQFEYKLPVVTSFNSNNNGQVQNKPWISYKRPTVDNANTLHMTPFFTTNVSLPATPTSCVSTKQQQHCRQHLNMLPHPHSNVALPPVPPNQTTFNHVSAAFLHMQQQQSEANHRAAMAAAAQNVSSGASVNLGYEQMNPSLRYSLIAPDSSTCNDEAEHDGGSIPPSPSYSQRSSGTVIPPPQYAEPYCGAGGNGQIEQQNYNVLPYAPAAPGTMHNTNSVAVPPYQTPVTSL